MIHHKYVSKLLTLLVLGASVPISLSFGGAAEIRKARQISNRLTGAPFSLGDSRLSQMETYLGNGQLSQAASIATNDPGFVNNILKEFAAPMHTKSQSIRDMRGTESMYYIMGIIRDSDDIRKILYGQDFYYNPSPNCNTPSRAYDRYGCANDYDQDLSSSANMAPRSTRLSPLYNNNGNGSAIPELPSEDHAGVFTMRGMGGTVGFAGTNRGFITHIVNQFWCLPLSAIRSGDGDMSFIGRDISRTPDGTTGANSTFNVQCKTCHGRIDSLRGAFAYIEGGRDLDGDGLSIRYKSSSGGVVSKYSRNSTNFPAGYNTTNNYWKSTFTPAQVAQFGWNGATEGYGVQSFAQALADSTQFYSCMVQKVAELVCPSDPAVIEAGGQQVMSQSVRDNFVNELKTHHNLKKTFQDMAVRPECVGG